MAYQRRKQSEFDLYHVMVRGAGRQLLFEDDEDRRMYLAGLRGLLEELPVELYAWCLMGNHVHLLFHAELDALARTMRELGRFYAQYYNRRHDRVGHLTQGRYRSVPVESEAQLLAVVRYIHRNPLEAGLSDTCHYQWSSFDDYLGRPTTITTTGPILALFSGCDQFATFHDVGADAREDVTARDRRVFKVGDDEALDILREMLGELGLQRVPLDDKAKRDDLLASLRDRGLPSRQIARITGVGRNVAARARHPAA